MTVEFQVLGCGDAMGSGGRLQTCFSLAGPAPGERYLVDCGATSMLALRRYGIDPLEVRAIVLSHLHGDHFSGLPFFLLDAKWVSRRREPLVIAGPPGTEERVLATMELLYVGSTHVTRDFDLRFVELAAGKEQQLHSLLVVPQLVTHESGAPAYALRLEIGGTTIGFSGDTEWTETLPVVAAGTDLFICEASFYDLEIPNHLNYTTLLSHRSELSCERILLTHLSSDMLERQEELELECAFEGQIIRF